MKNAKIVIVTVLLFVLAHCTVAVSKKYSEKHWQLFEDFKRKYNKIYLSETEEFQRFQIFQDNLIVAKQLNDSDPHAIYDVTKFMDLSREEFRNQYLLPNFTSPKKEGKQYPVLGQKFVYPRKLPVSFDWNSYGVVTPVYNQAGCGSCWAFSTTENIESMWAIAGHGLNSLAMQQLVDCDTEDHGCGGGNPPIAYQYVIGTGGMEDNNDYSYTGEIGYCQFNAGDIVASIHSWGYLTTVDNENEMASWTYQHGPPSICVAAQYWQFYSSGVITQNCGNEIDHCVQLTGWSSPDGIPAWNVRNSWGTNWGYSGYVFVLRGYDVCAIGQEVTSSWIQ